MSETQICKVCGESKPLNDAEFKYRPDSKKYRPECRACHNRIAAARRYGLSLEQYVELEQSQGGCCAICKVHADDVEHAVFTRLVVDHDHRTGEVRGMLCSTCNNGLGSFHDSVAKLRAAISYLSR